MQSLTPQNIIPRLFHIGIVYLGVLLIVLALTACVIEQDTVGASMTNPASSYCFALDGELEIKTGIDGALGLCHLPSGEVIEEWDLYRRDH
ncbi:DUF333 domain-containing protein [Shewanella sp. UCD-KL12]|uniref:putative hemolysin n=1 Tax=Shewanella sp. UCD-KL12 TaxID=1917163 RepID=UPI0009FB6619|nr:DUF333 domain-containing protein [Shewanella sp. UCD-KL12]